MDIANAIISKVADYTVEAVRRQLCYIIFYKKNLDDLVDKRRDLNGVREKVQNMVNDEDSKYSKIRDDVKQWLEKAAKLHEQKVSPDKMSPSCFNLIQRHKLGRKAKKMIEEINEIIQKGNTFDQAVGSLLPLSDIDTSSITGYQSIASRMSTAKVIKDALADNNNNKKFGIYGMGGVGKTVLVKEVVRLLKEQTLFDPVITLTIGQSMDVKGIQEKIKEMLRLTFTEETVEARAKLLLNNLKKMENKILIVLDDLWNELKLEDVGIPCGCKILITSRDKDVLSNEMGVKTNFIFEVRSLSESEAWEFFKNTIGEIDKNTIEPVAMKVAKKCGGLPIALDVVGKTLKGKTLNIWRDALKQLENPTAVMIKGVTTKVYGSLRLSYDFIENGEAKLIFLLCSVFPDDYEIPLEKLSMYAMGMRLLNGVNTLEEARDRIKALVDVLKSSSLLLKCVGKMNHVKMHDVVRDVAIHISSEEGSQMSTLCRSRRYEGSTEWRDECGSYRAIFANRADFHDLPQDLKFPKLELLILIGGFGRKELQQTFFAGMKELKVLDLSWMRFLKLMISSRNLRTLCMQGCEFRDIGEFKELEILRIDDCDPKELPKTTSQLTELKVLNVSCSHDLSDVRIPAKVISRMKNLEELSLLNSKGWGKSIKNAKLSEFKNLPHLTSLDLIIPSVNSLSDLSFSDHNLKLDRFHIYVGGDTVSKREEKSMRYLRISSGSEIVLNVDVDKIVLKRCDELSLGEASVGITKLLFKSNENYGYPDLRHLTLGRNSDMRHIIGDQVRNNLSCLDTLFLKEMESLENICHMDVRSNPFNKLRVIDVFYCRKLKNLFPFLVFDGLSNLQEIQVEGCISMDGIIVMKNEEATIKTECSIVSLIFGGVPQLTSFCSNQLTDQNLAPFFNNQVAFPKLERLQFERARNLKMLWKNNGMISNSFCKLQTIKIHICDNVRYMFPCSAMTTLVSLEVLDISICESLEAIFEMEEDGYNVKENDVPLPKLSYVRLQKCRKLKSVFPASVKRLSRLETLECYNVPCELLSSNSSLLHEAVFPTLRRVTMSYTAMKRHIVSLFSRSEWFPELKHLKLDDLTDYTHDDVDVDVDWMRLPLGFRQILCSLEELEIHYVNKWKDKTEIWKMFFDDLELRPSFSNLKSLSIDGCNGWKNSLNSSVVKRLVKLEKLFVSYCDGMISILDGEEEEEEEIIFDKLVVMKFHQLYKLESFHFGKSKIIFPCLEKLTISECDKMKIFSNGIVSAPKIQYLSINEQCFPTTDINSVFKKKPIKDQQLEDD